jgi:pyrimidine deaminase RibD-like protein
VGTFDYEVQAAIAHDLVGASAWLLTLFEPCVSCRRRSPCLSRVCELPPAVTLFEPRV